MFSEAEMTVRLWSLTEDALVEGEPEGGPLTVVTRWGEFTFEAIDARARESLRRMRLGPISLENVTPTSARKSPAAGVNDHRTLDEVLDVLSGSVVHSLGLDDRQGPLLSAVPTAPAVSFPLDQVPLSRPVRLSRFALIRPYGSALLLESPRAQFRVVLHRSLAAHIASALAGPRTIAQLAADLRSHGPIVGHVVAYLAAAGIVLVGDDAGPAVEDSDPALRLWAHHALTFHVRSRSRHGNGEDFAAEEALAASPAVKPPPAGRRFPLHRPEIAELMTDDASLTALLESDAECPAVSPNPLRAEQLGELLYRSARVRGPGPPRRPGGTVHEASQRPYFSLACLYELEIYLSLERCAGLPRGIFHYDPADHALTQLTSDDAALHELLEMARTAAGSARRPSALITVTARMDRMAALGSAAYATTLTHLGALQQTLCLVARAMGLRAHAVPVDANDTVERVIGLTWPAEVGVGECVLDSPS